MSSSPILECEVVLRQFTFKVQYTFDEGCGESLDFPAEAPCVELLSAKHGDDECLQDLYDRWPKLVEELATFCLNRELGLK